MPSKLDLVLIAGSVAAMIGWIEHGHSVVIDSPDLIELASSMSSCAENESIRYDTSQVVFLADGFPSGPVGQENAAENRTCEELTDRGRRQAGLDMQRHDRH